MSNKTPPSAANESSPSSDRYVEVLRDLPRLRSVDPADKDTKVYVAPPPFMSRMGGAAQGCGGVLLLIASVPMLMAAALYGFYVWGPTLFVAGAAVLLAATVGVWRGKRLPLILALLVILGMAALLTYWGTFIRPVVVLSPVLGSLAPYYEIIVQFTAFALLATFLVHIMTLFYWNRLKAPLTRDLITWGITVLTLVIVSFAFHVVQQQQRESWMTEHHRTWSQDAPAAPEIALGGNTNISLGISFTSFDDDTDDEGYAYRLADLDALAASGASPIRISASGDLLLEQTKARIFPDDEISVGETVRARIAAVVARLHWSDHPVEAVNAVTERIAAQQENELNYMRRLRESGAELMISDSRSSTYLAVQARDDGELDWNTFTALHEDRIRHYAELYQPEYYEVVAEPSLYYQFSGVKAPDSDEEKLEQWVSHTEDLIEIVNEVSPNTQVGVAVQLYDDFDIQFYEAALRIEGLDFISVKAYQPAALTLIEDTLAEKGHPRDFDKDLWIVETWYGYCLAPQRSMKLDALWLETVVTFAAQAEITGVLSSDYGCFVQPGGTVFAATLEEGGRTAVWETWKTLIEQYRPK